MLHRSTATDFLAFEKALDSMHTPVAPTKPPSQKLESLMRRWNARGVVRTLYPQLTPKDPLYFKTVDSFIRK